jgi:hypothetical protein
MTCGRTQQRLTLDGYQVLLNMCCGLAYMDMHPFTDDDWDSLPHVALTLETPWDLWVLDLEQSDDPNGFEHVDDPPLLNPDFDAHGDYCHHITQHAATLTTDDKIPDDDHGDYNPSTWTSLTVGRKNLMAMSHLVSYRLTCTGLSTQVLKPPWALILFPTTFYLLTMDHVQ